MHQYGRWARRGATVRPGGHGAGLCLVAGGYYTRGGGVQRSKKSLCAENQPLSSGPFHFFLRKHFLMWGGTGGGARHGHPAAPPDRGRSNTDTQNAGATPRGTRAGTPDKEEGHSKAGEATRTAGTGNQNGANGGACAWEAATIKGMAWPANPVATGCQGNPCSTGIRWGVSPAAQMGCLRNRSGSPSGADQP